MHPSEMSYHLTSAAGGCQEAAEEAVGQYAEHLMETYNSRTAQKLGLKQYDRDLSVGFMQLMYEDKADFTNTWRALADVSSSEQEEASTSGRDNGAASSIPSALATVRAIVGELVRACRK